MVFLDVEMPGLTGVAGRAARARAPQPARRRLRHGARALRGRRVRGRGVRLPAEAGRSGAARARASSACGSGRARTRCRSSGSPSSRAGGTELLDVRPGALRAGRRRLQPRAHLRPLAISARRRSASSRSGCRRRGSCASTARYLVNLAQGRGGPPRRRPTGCACSSPTRRARSSTSPAARRAPLRERLGSSLEPLQAARGRRRSSRRRGRRARRARTGLPPRRPRRAPRPRARRAPRSRRGRSCRRPRRARAAGRSPSSRCRTAVPFVASTGGSTSSTHPAPARAEALLRARRGRPRSSSVARRSRDRARSGSGTRPISGFALDAGPAAAARRSAWIRSAHGGGVRVELEPVLADVARVPSTPTIARATSLGRPVTHATRRVASGEPLELARVSRPARRASSGRATIGASTPSTSRKSAAARRLGRDQGERIHPA